jgi:hypothetical protein
MRTEHPALGCLNPEAVPSSYSIGIFGIIHSDSKGASSLLGRGAGFSRFLQLVPCEGESQTTGKLCVLHFFYKGQLNIASLCNGRTKRKWDAMLNLESGGRIKLFYEDSPEATICATVNRLLSDRLEGMGLV